MSNNVKGHTLYAGAEVSGAPDIHNANDRELARCSIIHSFRAEHLYSAPLRYLLSMRYYARLTPVSYA